MAVHNGSSPEKVLQVAQERGYTFPVGVDQNGAVHRAYGITLRPTTAVIGPDGQLMALRAGAHTAEQWRAELVRFGMK